MCVRIGVAIVATVAVVALRALHGWVFFRARRIVAKVCDEDPPYPRAPNRVDGQRSLLDVALERPHAHAEIHGRLAETDPVLSVML